METVLPSRSATDLMSGVTGDDLHLLHIQSSDSGEIRIGEPLKQPLAVIGVAHHVGLDEAQLGHVHLHLLDVVLGSRC